MMIFGLLALSLVIFVFVIPFGDLARLGIFRAHQNSALESACLAAAEDLSTIVIEDPYYGYIALTNYGPAGRATLAPDREPLPVLGINTIWATCREELLVAEMLDNNYMRDLAATDISEARRATTALEKALTTSMQPDEKQIFKDLNGNRVQPYEHARQLLDDNNGQGTALNRQDKSSLRLSLGWLDEPTDSCVPLPQPDQLARLPKHTKFGSNYRAFTDLSVGSQSFYLAGFGKQASLVDPQKFKPPDGKQICSIVRAETTLAVPASTLNKAILGNNLISIKCTACSEPGAIKDTTIPGILKLSFVNGIIPRLRCPLDILNDEQLSRSKIDIYSARGGDYPKDGQTSLTIASQNDSGQPITRIFATGLFDWIRAAHNKIRLDSLLNVLQLSFDDSSITGGGSRLEPILLYEVTSDGSIAVTNLLQNPFPNQCVHENQNYALSFNAYRQEDILWTFGFRDQVRYLGTTYGGKHAGELMPADPLNWCDLAYYGGSPDWAARRMEGTKATGLIVRGKPDGCEGGSEAVSADSATFLKQDGKALSVQPRKTYYSGGLAVEMKFESPVQASLGI